MKTRTIWLWSIALLLGFVPLARGATIVGPDTVCRGGSEIYKAEFTAGTIYDWTVTNQGAVTSTTTYQDSSLATILWSNAGTATITLYVIDPNTGDTLSTSTKTVYVYGPPSLYLTSDVVVACTEFHEGDPLPDSTVGCTKYCKNSTVVYTLHGDTTGTTTWTVTGGTISSSSMGTCTVIWGAGASGSITVTEVMPWGCETTVSLCIQLIDPPTADFAVAPDPADTVVCDSSIVVFVDNSTAAANSQIVSWYWDFGDGFYSGQPGGPLATVSHQYNTPGNYTATLVVTNECGCTDTAHIHIEVLDSTGVKITCPSVVCENDTATYTVDATCSVYNWSVTGGTIVSPMPYTNVIRIVWDDPSSTNGIGTVTFTPDTACELACAEPTTVFVPIVQQAGTIQGLATVCPYSQYIYRLPKWPTTEYNWYVESVTGLATLTPTDQPNEIALNTASGPDVIQVKCNYHNTLLGCGGLASLKVKVRPASSISVQAHACLGDNVGGEIAPFPTAVANWTITAPDNTQTTSTGHTFNFTATQVGTYMIEAVSPTDVYCPPDAAYVTVDTVQRPDSIVGPDTICRGEPILFTAMNPMPNTVFHWQATGGTVNAVYGNSTYATFTGTGPFSISVWRETVYGIPHCQSVAISKDLDTPFIDLNIGDFDTVCGSSTHTYATAYTEAETYNWTIVPATAGSVSPVNGSPSVTVLWNNPPPAGQDAWLILKVQKCGGTYLDSMHVHVWGNPDFTVVFTPDTDTICAGTVLAVSLDPTAPATTTWDFGDGYVTTGSTASHAYATFNSNDPVSYTITATVTNAHGCLGSYVFTRDIWVKPAPVAFVTPVGAFYYCNDLPDNVVLTADAQSGYGGPITSYEWYGCATCPTYGNTLTVNDLGNYYCVVTNSLGCSTQTNVVQFLEHCTPEDCTPLDGPVTVGASVARTACGELTFTGTTSGGVVWSRNWASAGSSGITQYASGPNWVGEITYDNPGVYDGFFQVGFESANMQDTCPVEAHATDTIFYIAKLLYTVTCDSTNPGHYLVTLFDNSPYYPITPPDNYAFTITGPTSGSQSGPSTTYSLSVLPGSYTFGLTIGDGLHDDCSTSLNVTLPALPSASFTYTFDSACAGDTSVIFTNTSTGASSYLWQLDLTVYNYQADPYIVYPSQGYKKIILYAINEYGCADTATDSVYVHDRDLSGILTLSPAYACQGDPVNLDYLPTLPTFPGYPEYNHWYKDNMPFAYTTVSNLDVYEPGAYWLTGTDHYGCRVTTPPVVPQFTQVPPAIVYGDTSQCVNVPFTLSGYVGFMTSYVYAWIIDGVPYPGTAELTQVFSSAGVHTYQVVDTVTGPAGDCYDTSDVFTVTVHPLPAPPTVSVSVLDCPSYELQLSASDVDDPGFYNWSNGMTGSTINVYQGGLYKVTFTDSFGCKSNSDITVPRDPKAYMWTFPTGCYTFCYQFMPRTLVGPITAFNYWAYLLDLNVSSDGSYSVPSPYVLDTAGTYNFVLDNGLCRDTSGDMSVTIDSMCNCGGVRWVQIDSIYKDTTDGGCEDFITIGFLGANTAGPLGWAASAHHGTLLPYSGTEPASYTGSETLRYIADPSFTGPNDTLVITITYLGHTCVMRIPIKIYPCDNSYAPRPGNNGDSLVRHVNSIELISKLAELMVVPNPAQNSTRVDYRYSVAGANRYLELYDMTGRLIARHAAEADAGSWQIDLSHYAAGMYIVLLRQEGRVLLQSKLSILR
ncbi:MAG: hypothetical protein BGO69_10960 [Bacteroidetes bacterium 46-16]|nr:MAG: hypothetical protein BGO69_10960 [Bacteroidetes bacterium 46-16]